MLWPPTVTASCSGRRRAPPQAYFRELELTDTERLIADRVIREIRERLTFLDDVGVGYLSLNRAARTLSVARPSASASRRRSAQPGGRALHPRRALDRPAPARQRAPHRDARATADIATPVIVVEHDEETMRSADWVIDMGPARVCTADASSPRARRRNVANTPGSLTGQYLAGRRAIAVPARREGKTSWLKVSGVTANNLQGIDVEIPIGRFVSVTGVSGSGKSTLVNDVVYRALANRLLARAPQAGQPPGDRGARAVRQGDRDRPVADRPNAALEPCDVHRSVLTCARSSTP